MSAMAESESGRLVDDAYAPADLDTLYRRSSKRAFVRSSRSITSADQIRVENAELRRVIAKQRHQQLVARDALIGAEAIAHTALAARRETEQLFAHATQQLNAVELLAAQLHGELNDVRVHRDELEHEIDRIKRSESWRLGLVILKPWALAKRLFDH